jgi:alkylation response protein AidB-like acyl-CoA dehydrogenase
MDFAWTEEQQRFHDEVVRFARAELNEDVPGRDARGEFPRRAWRACARLGIQGLPVPSRDGGSGADALTIVRAMEALGYGCTDGGLVFGLSAQLWSCEQPLVRFGTEEQRRRHLPGLVDGSRVGVQAMTEPGSGSDALGMATRAERRGDRWVLHGTKTFVTNAPVADVFVVFASTDPDDRLTGVTAFLVERGAPGLSTGPPIEAMGLRTAPLGEVVLDGCEVGEEQVLGRPGSGMAVFNHAMEWERACILAGAVGTMRRQVERCVEHARSRRQFGKPIGKFQAVAHRIVEMQLRLETSRLLLYRLGWLLSRGEATAMDASLAKLHVSEAFLRSSLDAVQVHGAFGYAVEAELEREVRDAVGGRIYSGTSEMQRNIAAGYLGL